MNIVHYTFEERCKKSNNLIVKYPDRIPIIVKPYNIKDTKNIIKKNKFLVPGELTVGQINYVIRKRIKLSKEKALFIFFNNNILPTSMLLYDAYLKYKNEDGFLYANYSFENTFG
jgi:GABA(A) receptor-associated protein